MTALVPAELAFAGDGTPYSPAYGDVYHASQGALEQASHVFLAGNELLGEKPRWRERDAFVILETGFGIGLSFLATWQAWREAGRPCQLHFVSVEKHPFRRDDLRTLLARHAELAPLAKELLAHWPLPIAGFHRLHFDAGRVTLTLLLGEAETLLPKLVARVDAVYLDGFAPSKNPELWSPALLATITRLCAPDATLATWSVAGELRRSLEAQKWCIERRPGFASKREMLCARRIAPEIAPEIAVPPAPTFARERHAIVIGAGLAGTATAERLTARGWRVDLIERRPEPAQEASGNAAGIMLPRMAKDDALAARLSRACFLYARRALAGLSGARWSPCGVFQIATDAADEKLQRAAVAYLQAPSDYVEFLEREEAERRLGHPVALGGWWFPGGGWVAPRTVCAALLAAAPDVTPHFGREVSRLEYRAPDWFAYDAAGGLIASAPHVVLANAAAANRLLPAPLQLISVRGQVSILPADYHERLHDIHTALCRGSYLTPPAAGTVCFGASFTPDDDDAALRLADHEENLARLEELLPGRTTGISADTLAGRVGFRTTTRDRLPMVGPVANLDTLDAHKLSRNLPDRIPGLHVILGLGARGIAWGPLAAELLAARMNGDPLPVEKELVAAVDPARFYVRERRRQGAA